MGTTQSKEGSKAGGTNSDLEFDWVRDPSGSKTLKIYFPGFSADQIKVKHDTSSSKIMIDGKRPAVTDIHFRKEFPIPETSSDQIQAVFEKGVLLVTFSGAKTPSAEIMVLQGRTTIQEGVIQGNIQITMPQTIPSRPSPAPFQKPETQPTQKDDEEKKRKEFESGNAQQTEQEPKPPSLEAHAGKVTSDREEKDSPVAAEMVLQGRATSQEGVIHANIQITMPQTIPSWSSPAPTQKPETQPTQKDDEEKKRKEFESGNAQQTEQEPKPPSLETHAGKVTSDSEEKGSPVAAMTLAPVAAEMVLQSRATYQEGVIHVQITMPQTIPSSQRPSPAPSQKPETQPTQKDKEEKKKQAFQFW
ncbi:uncharacterized protein [Aristolochia californica]|uniref:uncharacterized protein n=1 Tax=Aristolochia californica TaxID=171875 RepID=UPI0035E16728